MNRLLKVFSLYLVTIVILCGVLIMPKKVLSFSFNPVPFLQKTTDVVVQRVSDIIYYLIMQKRYIFNDFTDPNIYPSAEIPPVVNNILASTTPKVDEEKPTTKPIIVATSTPPSIKPINIVNAPISQSQIIPTIPILIVKPNIPPEPAEPVINDWSDSENNSQILIYTNDERGKLSIVPLVANYTLNKIADLRADDLFANQYFEHQSPDGKSAPDLAGELGYGYLLIGENLALGNFKNDQEIVSAWMESPGHKANILNGKYSELGVSVKSGLFKGEEVTLAVQIFAVPLSACSRPNQQNKNLIDSSTISIKQMQVDAKIMYDNLNNIKNIPGVDHSYYNQKIDEYNYYARKVNEAVVALKNLVDIYNTEVNKYNLCINN